MRFSRLLPQVWVRLAVVTSGCSRIPSSDDGLIAVCSASRDECAVGQPVAARLRLTQPGWRTDCTCLGRRNQPLPARGEGRGRDSAIAMFFLVTPKTARLLRPVPSAASEDNDERGGLMLERIHRWLPLRLSVPLMLIGLGGVIYLPEDPKTWIAVAAAVIAALAWLESRRSADASSKSASIGDQAPRRAAHRPSHDASATTW